MNHNLQIDLQHGHSVIVIFDDSANILRLHLLRPHRGVTLCTLADFDNETQANIQSRILRYLFDYDLSL